MIISYCNHAIVDCPSGRQTAHRHRMRPATQHHYSTATSRPSGTAAGRRALAPGSAGRSTVARYALAPRRSDPASERVDLQHIALSPSLNGAKVASAVPGQLGRLVRLDQRLHLLQSVRDAVLAGLKRPRSFGAGSLDGHALPHMVPA